MLHIETPQMQAAIALQAEPFRSRVERLFAPHTTIFHQGQFDRHLYRIADGCVAIYQLLNDGRRQIIDILGPGRLIGSRIAGSGNCAVEALTYTRLEPASADLARTEIDSEIEISLERARNHATLLGRKNAEEKVASAVFDLACQFARKTRTLKWVTFNLYLTRADLADWLGLTVETVSRILNQFKRDRLIAYEHAELVTVLDPAALQTRAAITTHSLI